MREAKKAQEWRRARGLTVERLSELTGYSVPAIRSFESGRGAVKNKPWIWQRYKMCCAGVEAQARGGMAFTWQP